MVNGKISETQFVMIITAFLQGSVLALSFNATTKHDTWLAVLAGFILFIPVTLCYASLAKRFAGLNLMQMSEAILGPYWGKGISLMYSWFFLILLALNVRDLGNFYTIQFMPETPLPFFIIVFAAVCAYAVYIGIEVLARLGVFFVAIPFIIIPFTSLLLFKDMSISAFLPIFSAPLKEFIHGTHIITAIPLGETVMMLMFIPSLNSTERITKNALLGLFFGTICLLAVSVRNTAVLGYTEYIWSSPSLQAVRLIDIGNVLTRLDVLIGIGHTFMMFFKCSLLYYCVVLSLAQLLRLKTYTPLILPIGLIAITLSMIMNASTVEREATGDAHLMQASLFSLIFPPVLLLIAKLRNLPDKRNYSEKSN